MARTAVAVVDLQGQGTRTAELAEVMQGPASLAGRRVVIAQGDMLYDAALEPLYTTGEPIEEYVWQAKHAAGYDPEAQNSWGDLPLFSADIKDPDDEYRGLAPKDMSKDCSKDGSCQQPENVWAYLPDVEAKSMSTKGPHVPAENAWDDMPFDY